MLTVVRCPGNPLNPPPVLRTHRAFGQVARNPRACHGAAGSGADANPVPIGDAARTRRLQRDLGLRVGHQLAQRCEVAVLAVAERQYLGGTQAQRVAGRRRGQVSRFQNRQWRDAVVEQGLGVNLDAAARGCEALGHAIDQLCIGLEGHPARYFNTFRVLAQVGHR